MSYIGYLFLFLLVIPAFTEKISYSPSDSTLIQRQEELSSDLVIQVGAFRMEQNALALKDRLSAAQEKTVVIISEDGYFKVRITGFKSPEELEKILPGLGLLGIKNLWIVPVRQPEEIKPQVVVRADSSVTDVKQSLELLPSEEKVPLTSVQGIALQAGVFHRRSKAYRARRRITTKLGLPVEIVQEWEYYKLIIPGFHSTEETHEYYPKLAKLGYPDIYPIENYSESR